MVRAWYMDDKPDDQRQEHQKNPPQFITVEDLFSTTGVEYFKLKDKEGKLETIKKERDYTYEDELECSRKCLPNYEEKLKSFYQEHLHTEEEIRAILDGSGYFDVRDKNDKWIRIEVVAGDMLVLPSGIYHRFTLDTQDYIKAKRLFIGKPVWTPHNRPSDTMDCRKNYLQSFQNGQFVKIN